MKAFLAGVRRWWLRRYRGVVKPPVYAPQGTIWQQHFESGIEEYGAVRGWVCDCGELIVFTEKDYVIREQNHVDGCPGLIDAHTHHFADLNKTPLMDLRPCQCPVTDARYIKHCPNCRRGHWKQAKP